MSSSFGPRRIHGDDVIAKALSASKKAEGVIKALADDPQIKDSVQTAIDNPPRTHDDQGHIITGAPSPATAIRRALIEALAVR
jgi:hypothetical protein